jgi:hypothetical protein
MPTYKCRKCLPTNVPDEWTIEKKAEIADLIRKTSHLSAIQFFRPIGMDLIDAKNISFHVTNKKGHCRGCGKELVEYEGNCTKCKRLNLDW